MVKDKYDERNKLRKCIMEEEREWRKRKKKERRYRGGLEFKGKKEN